MLKHAAITFFICPTMGCAITCFIATGGLYCFVFGLFESAVFVFGVILAFGMSVFCLSILNFKQS
jgi:hypothetical protein